MGGKKGRQTAGKSASSDFTLNDYANVAGVTGRMRKGDIKPLKEVEVQPTEINKEDLAWDEKDLSDFEILDEETAVEVEQKENEGARSIRSRSRRRQHNAPMSQSEGEDSGLHYPQDLWFLIGSYIHPEDVARFACLCRATHAVAHSAKFWLSMYERHYRGSSSSDGDSSPSELPPLLQPHAISHVHGLRTRVVRSLFFAYAPFRARTSRRSLMEHGDPDSLTGARCTLQWHQKLKAGWNFFFKFKFNVQPCPLSKPKTTEDDLMAEIDIYSNLEENCCVLQVASPNFISLPVVMGQVLTKSFISVGHQMQFHKLKLLFNADFNARKQMTTGTAIVMDPVVNVMVCPWWDPKYPYNTT